MNTDCRKCGAKMPELKKSDRKESIYQVNFLVTGFRCLVCGHWNNFKCRKGYAEYRKEGGV